MFILVPAIIIFLLLSYLHLNEVGFVAEILVYSLIIFVAGVSLFLYKTLKSDFLQQEVHRLEADIALLENRLKNTQEKNKKKQIEFKIEQIQNEIDSKLQNK